jgi:V/A-type H+-transporting ATPase subunit I
MMFTTRMKYLTAVVLDRDVEKVTKELLSNGVLHFVHITEVSTGLKNKVGNVVPEVSLTRLAEIKKRIESFLGMIGVMPEKEKTLDISRLQAVDLEQTEKQIDGLSERVGSIRDRQKNIQQEILKLEDIRRQIELFGDIRSSMKARSHFTFLNVQTGLVPTAKFEEFNKELATLPSVALNFHSGREQSSVLLITMKRDDARVNALLTKYSWEDAELDQELTGVKEDVALDLDGKLKTYTREQRELQEESLTVIREQCGMLEELWANLRMNELYYKIQSYFSKTSRTMIFSGWLPASKTAGLGKDILSATGGRCYLEWSDPEKLEKAEKTKISVPVQLKNPKFLSPFQMLVKNYAIPEYGTVDPTPFVAVAYLIMFGLMFGDAGHGLVLLLLGLGGMFFYRKNRGDWFNLAKLVTYCGGMAIVTGVAFGSYFGMRWISPLWFDYHALVLGHVPDTGLIRDIYGVLLLTLYFGIVVIVVGLLLNWINLVRHKRWLKLLLDKTGLLGAWAYGGGIYLGYYYMTRNAFPGDNTLLFLAIIPMLLFLLKPPLTYFARPKESRHPFTVMTFVDFFMEWIVELLEAFGGYLANTLSFMRVAGLGIAHASLMIAFFDIAKMTGSPVFSLIIIVAGNMLVIALEGLSAGIQSLRLNYYEFFSKYFSGTGEAYAPVSLTAGRE